jgi:hypothetical protein
MSKQLNGQGAGGFAVSSPSHWFSQTNRTLGLTSCFPVFEDDKSAADHLDATPLPSALVREGRDFTSAGFTWDTLRVNLLESIETVMSEMRRPSVRQKVAEESKELLREGVNAVKARLIREGLTNEQIQAAVRKSDAESARELAAERKTHAEAASIEIRNAIDRLRLVIGMSLAVAAAEGTSHATAELNALLKTLDAIAR